MFEDTPIDYSYGYGSGETADQKHARNVREQGQMDTARALGRSVDFTRRQQVEDEIIEKAQAVLRGPSNLSDEERFTEALRILNEGAERESRYGYGLGGFSGC